MRLKTNYMEIKKGDIVRVPTDIPQFYLRYNSMRIFEQTFSVVDIEGGLALLGSTTTSYKAVIPCKYLIKVDAEAEENARVRQMEAELDKFRKAELDRMLHPEKYYTYEPTEQTEAHTDANEKLQEEYMRFMKGCMSGEIYTQSDFLKDYDPAKHEVNPKPRCIPKIMFNTEFWVKYEADLAKEIALKVANRYNDPEETAKYAAKAAKQIVKHLKENE